MGITYIRAKIYFPVHSAPRMKKKKQRSSSNNKNPQTAAQQSLPQRPFFSHGEAPLGPTLFGCTRHFEAQKNQRNSSAANSLPFTSRSEKFLQQLYITYIRAKIYFA